MEVKEGSAYRRTISFETDGLPVTPTTVHWSLRCQTTNTELLPLTQVATASSLILLIPASANRIIRPTNPYETKVITVVTDYGTDEQMTDEEPYRVKNLGGIADPVDSATDDYGD